MYSVCGSTKNCSYNTMWSYILYGMCYTDWGIRPALSGMQNSHSRCKSVFSLKEDYRHNEHVWWYEIWFLYFFLGSINDGCEEVLSFLDNFCSDSLHQFIVEGHDRNFTWFDDNSIYIYLNVYNGFMSDMHLSWCTF